MRNSFRSKLVIRDLPATLNQAKLEEFLIPWAEYINYTSLHPGKVPPSFSTKLPRKSRAFVNFTNANVLLDFVEKVKSQPYTDEQGVEHIIKVEFAPFQIVPPLLPSTEVKEDVLCGTIENDEHFKKFLEELERTTTTTEPLLSLNEQLGNMVFKERELNPWKHNKNSMKATPLLEHLNTEVAKAAYLSSTPPPPPPVVRITSEAVVVKEKEKKKKKTRNKGKAKTQGGKYQSITTTTISDKPAVTLESQKFTIKPPSRSLLLPTTIQAVKDEKPVQESNKSKSESDKSSTRGATTTTVSIGETFSKEPLAESSNLVVASTPLGLESQPTLGLGHHHLGKQRKPITKQQRSTKVGNERPKFKILTKPSFASVENPSPSSNINSNPSEPCPPLLLLPQTALLEEEPKSEAKCNDHIRGVIEKKENDVDTVCYYKTLQILPSKDEDKPVLKDSEIVKSQLNELVQDNHDEYPKYDKTHSIETIPKDLPVDLSLKKSLSNDNPQTTTSLDATAKPFFVESSTKTKQKSHSKGITKGAAKVSFPLDCSATPYVPSQPPSGMIQVGHSSQSGNAGATRQVLNYQSGSLYSLHEKSPLPVLYEQTKTPPTLETKIPSTSTLKKEKPKPKPVTKTVTSMPPKATDTSSSSTRVEGKKPVALIMNGGEKPKKTKPEQGPIRYNTTQGPSSRPPSIIPLSKTNSGSNSKTKTKTPNLQVDPLVVEEKFTPIIYKTNRTTNTDA